MNTNINSEYELTLHDYIDIIRRRALIMIAVFLLVVATSSAFAVLLSPVYQSSGTILIESQQISSEFIANTVTGFASERIEIIKQRVMTRENLLRIIKKYGLFQSGNGSRVTSELINNLRNNIGINILSTGGRRGGRATIAFSISYQDRYPELAYRVTSELITLFLDENIKSRVERATETTEFLAQEARRLKGDLEKMESLVATYKQEHADALPEHLGLKLDILQRTETALAELDRDYKATENELKRLDLELTAAKTGTVVGETAVSELDQLKDAYRQASINYKDTHPTIRSLKRRIESIEKGGDSNGGTDNTDQAPAGTINNELVVKLQTLITTARSRLRSLNEQRKPMREKVTRMEQQIIKTPQVELGLSTLLRDHNNAQKKYEEIQAKQLSAQIAENLEGENKSERFTLIDPPLLPDKPIKPNRFKIMLLGLFAAFGAAGGLAFLLEMLNQRIRGNGALTTVLGSSPLVEIPYIRTSDEHLRRKLLIIKGIFVMAILFVVSLIVIHFTYMDLDILFFKVLARLGW